MSLSPQEPFHVLETLVNNARCCVLNTRVGARSGATTEIREEPIAYLLDNREANNDPANFRVFSHHAYFPWRSEPVGGRSGRHVRLACLMDSNPAAAEADGRMLLFLRSQLCYDRP